MIALAKRKRRRAIDGDHLVERALSAAAKPLSAYDIRDSIMAAGDRISVAQIYRIVARLTAAARIRKVESRSAYVLGGEPHVAVTICARCSAVSTTPMADVSGQLHALIEAQGFQIEDVIVEARGRCARCLGALD